MTVQNFKNKAKIVILAFSGMIVYTSLYLCFSCLFGERVLAKFVTCIICTIVGDLYIKTVLGYPAVEGDISRRFISASCVATILFVITSFFTTSYILTAGLQDAAYASTIMAKMDLPTGWHILSLIISVVLMPITEEIIFRGFMYRQLVTINKPLAIIFSSMFFAIWHGTIIHIYPALLGGVIFACLYDKTNKLRYSIVAHMMFNAVTTLLGIFKYPNVFGTMWFVIVVNVVCVVSIVLLFRTKTHTTVERA